MHTRTAIVLSLLLSLVLALPQAVRAAAVESPTVASPAVVPTAEQVMAAANRFISFSDIEAVFDMEVRSGDRLDKRYVMRIKAKDRDRMRIEFEEPAREKGRIILRVKDKMWMFLPDLGKAMVISSRQAFMGSAASNGDLLRTDLVSDYVPSLASGTDPGQPYRLELKARAPDVTYDRIVMWVARADFRPLRAEYYTRSGKRLKTLEYGDPAVIDGIAVNRRMTIHSDLQRDQVTVLSIVSLTPAPDLPESMFVKENLDRR